MLRRISLAGAVGTALIAAAAGFAPAAHANSNVGFSVSIGAPGFAATVGNAPYAGFGYGPFYGPFYGPYWRPAVVPVPVVYPPVVYAAPFVVRPVVVSRPVYRRPYYRGW